MDKYYTLTEFIQLVRISRPTAYKLIHEGKIPAIRVGKAWRIPRETLEVYTTGEKHG